MRKEEARQIMEQLYKFHPDAKCELNYNTPFELLIATVLSAQTTDISVNKVTPHLFARYKNVYELAAADINDVRKIIKTIGLYKNKSKNIVLLSRRLIEDFDGEVPRTIPELVTLEGVGRKTANVVISNAFNIPGFAVDTHVFRVANRIGITRCKDVACSERTLKRKIEKENWIKAHHTMIFHGRYICKSRKPACEICVVNSSCKYYMTQKKKSN